MGPLALPTQGSVYLDANCFIYSVERVEPYRTLLEPLWQHARAGLITVVSSELTISEALVKPLREDDAVVDRLFRSLFDASEVHLFQTTRSLWEDTARLRAATGLKTPDALHAATALHVDCASFVTNDANFRRVPGLPVLVLDDVLAEDSGR